SSRFGPTVPVAPASFSVWQVLQPAVSNTCLPAVTSAAPPPAGVGVEGGGGDGGGAAVVAALVPVPVCVPATEATYAATSSASVPVTRSAGIPCGRCSWPLTEISPFGVETG